ncbi:hypothetical protein O1611_g8871 [Lasiodiplodia mahajangana]|uniref:Uncharacterized protein n=1 Tax=Lasiodiplodia mahajangana TaxID=1108764 RepID=A0ACC2JBG0_9PEZI|nr:hypothetical protein O1611_g8871 [Lasiodiplodia mahajangana]
MGREVVDYEDEEGERPAVVFADGERVVADIVVGADGIKSRARELVLGFADAPKSSGYSCYRAYFPGAHLKEDPLCREFVNHDCVNIWIGEDTHLVQNTLRNGDEFNWIVTRKLSHEADMEIRESWFQEGDLEDVARVTATVDPRIRAAVAKTPSCLDWKICYRDPLPTWVSPRSHRIALLGDSCHPHLPTSAQGASQATESAAVLAVCLKLAGKERIPLATRTYEKLRFARTRASQRNGEDLRDRWHNALKDVDDGIEIDPESLKIRNRWLYAFDAEADTIERWEEVSSLLVQIVIAAYGAMQSQVAITKLLEYEDATKKLAKISSEAERQLHKTRTTQAAGAITILVSFAASVLLLIIGWSYGFWVHYLISQFMVLAVFAAKTYIQNFWAGKNGRDATANKIPLPKMRDYNEALERTEETIKVLGWLTMSWVASSASSALAVLEGF